LRVLIKLTLIFIAFIIDLTWDFGICFSQSIRFDFTWCQFWWVKSM